MAGKFFFLFLGVMAYRFAWSNMYSHLLRLHAIDLKVESMCALVCCVLSLGFLKKKLDEQKNALMWLLDRMHVTAVIVLIIQLLFVQIAWRNLFLY